MSTYGFRIRFLLPNESAINHDADTLEIRLPTEDKTLVFQSSSGTSIGASNNLTVRGSGFSSESEAYTYGQLTKNSLILCSTRLRMGIQIGKDKASSGVGKTVRDRARKTGILLLNDVLGLCVYPEDMPVRFVSVKGTAVLGHNVEKFIKEFETAIKFYAEFTDKQSLAFELYGASHFESSLRARFLTLVSAVESLCSRSKQSDAVIAHLENLIDLTKRTLAGREADLLVNRLGDLKTESISTSCRKLVEQYLGIEAAGLFKTCYDIRSEMIHTGKPQKGCDLGTYVPRLDDLVSRLLIATVTAS